MKSLTQTFILLLSLLPAMSWAGVTDQEAKEQNTPEGWNAVQLPQMPAITTANTFTITDYGASVSSADNTQAIQAALDAANKAGGGMVVIPAGEWLFGRITIGSKTILHLSKNATLKLLAFEDQPDHTLKTPYITGKSNASDIIIEGESKETSIIEGQGGPWWDAVEAKVSGLQRGAMIRFHQGQRYLFRNFRIQNAPGTNLTVGQSGKGAHTTIHDVDIFAPASTAADPSHNTDGIPIWSQYVNIYNCLIDTGDDNVVTDSNAQYIHVWNCQFKAGHGASLGSYTVNMHHIIYEDITFEGTDSGFRLKSNIDRSGDVHDIIFRNCTMTNVATPIQITAWYDKVPESPEAAEASPEAKKSTTPEYHNILIQNVTATGYNTKNSNDKNYNAIMIYGRPESYVYDVTFDHVNISHRNGIRMFFCKDIKFIDCSFTKTRTNQTVTATDTDLSPVMEKSYQVVYSWNVTSGINAVGTSSANDATCYSLQGYRLSEKPRRHSVYIQNKKKWIR
jgi:polygalacturonase